MYTPPETLEIIKKAAKSKSTAKITPLLLKSFLAGLFIAFAALISTIVSANLLKDPNTFGLGKLVQGFTFSGGLIMVVLSGAELFTGNSLMFIALFDRTIGCKGLLKNWTCVLLGNTLGAVSLALLASLAGTFSMNSGLIGDTLASFALSKSSLPIISSLILGFLCNILVCIAVYSAFSAKSLSGKLLACIFPVTFFVASGYEHSIANLFYIPAGIFAGAEVSFLGLLNNLLPVLVGNILGGFFLSVILYFGNPTKSTKITTYREK